MTADIIQITKPAYINSRYMPKTTFYLQVGENRSKPFDSINDLNLAAKTGIDIEKTIQTKIYTSMQRVRLITTYRF